MRFLPLVFAARLLCAQTDLALEEGKAVFRSNCAFCHGLTGRGGRGPNLVSGRLGSDDEVKRIVKAGVPGTTMPSFEAMEADELDALVKYLRFLAGSGAGSHAAVAGDARLGDRKSTRLNSSHIQKSRMPSSA